MACSGSVLWPPVPVLISTSREARFHQRWEAGNVFSCTRSAVQKDSFLHLSETGDRRSLEFKIPHVLFSFIAYCVLSLAYLKLSKTVRQGSLCAIEIYLIKLDTCTEGSFLSAKTRALWNFVLWSKDYCKSCLFPHADKFWMCALNNFEK